MKFALRNPVAFIVLTLLLVGAPIVIANQGALYYDRGVLSDIAGFWLPVRRGQHHFAEYAVLANPVGTLRVVDIYVLMETEPEVSSRYWFDGGVEDPIAFSIWYRHKDGFGLILQSYSHRKVHGTLEVNKGSGFTRPDVVSVFESTAPDQPPHYFVDFKGHGFDQSRNVHRRLHPVGILADGVYVFMALGWLYSLRGIRTWPAWVRSKVVHRTGCENCGYSRDGLITDTCPECGYRSS